YVGKHYDGDAHTEVFSMGMEGLFARSGGGMRGLGDPAPAYLSGSDSQVKFQESEVFDAEHRDLIFGLLASHRTLMGKARGYGYARCGLGRDAYACGQADRLDPAAGGGRVVVVVYRHW